VGMSLTTHPRKTKAILLLSLWTFMACSRKNHSLFHARMTYGIIFWGNSSHSTQVFRMQKKKAIRIITGHGNRESRRNLFKELNILPLMSQYTLSLLTFVSNNREQYFANSEIHNINTRHTSNLYLPSTHFEHLPKRSLLLRC
jgi:hypothetical protein